MLTHAEMTSHALRVFAAELPSVDEDVAARTFSIVRHATILISRETARLSEVLSFPGPHRRAVDLGMYIGRFDSFRAMATYVGDTLTEMDRLYRRFDRVHRWAIWRADDYTAEPEEEPSRRQLLYQLALRDVRASTGAIFRDPDFRWFVTSGAKVDWLAVRGPCERLGVLAPRQEVP